LTAKNDTEVVLRRMNEVGVLGRFIPDFGRIVSMMQFNMYHHYTVDEHLLRCIGVLAEIEAGTNPEYGLANELAHTIKPEHRDVARGTGDTPCAAAPAVRRPGGRLSGPPPAAPETAAWLIEHPLTMWSIPPSRALPARRTIENFSPIVQSLERMKLLTIPTTA